MTDTQKTGLKTVILPGIIILALLLALALYSNTRLQRGLPKPEVFATQQEAQTAAMAAATEIYGAEAQNGVGWSMVSGTGSMQPYIPAAPAGMDPRQTICAYVVFDRTTYADLKGGELCAYTVQGYNGRLLHIAANKESSGGKVTWTMSGLHNSHSEPFGMDEAHFRGVARRVFLWKP